VETSLLANRHTQVRIIAKRRKQRTVEDFDAELSLKRQVSPQKAYCAHASVLVDIPKYLLHCSAQEGILIVIKNFLTDFKKSFLPR